VLAVLLLTSSRDDLGAAAAPPLLLLVVVVAVRRDRLAGFDLEGAFSLRPASSTETGMVATEKY